MRLTDTAIRNAKPKEKPYKLTDGKGLYLLVNKTGKYFRYDYRFNGKRKTFALGVYPDVKLQDARTKLEDARILLRNNIDPGENKKALKNSYEVQAANSFETISREWFAKNIHTWTEGHSKTIIQRLEANVFPWLGSRPMAEISAPEVLVVLRRIEDRGAIETAHRIKQVISQVFRYAIATSRAKHDPSSDLRGALAPSKSKRMATITDPQKVGQLLRSIDVYEGQYVTKCALRLAPLVFVRPGELRHAEWCEINFDKTVWKIPGKKMKMGLPHIVPLSRQAVAILLDIEPLTGRGRYVFPGLRTAERPMSENTILSALRNMGYAKEEMSGHGFRAMASTLLHEQGYAPHLIEKQLAHAERNSVKAAYNYAQYLNERKIMMQEWADYLDHLKESDNGKQTD